MSSDSDESGKDTTLSHAVKPKKKKYSKTYNTSWESDKDLKWRKSSAKGSTYAYCVVCCTGLTLKAGNGDLKKICKHKKAFRKVFLDQEATISVGYAFY